VEGKPDALIEMKIELTEREWNELQWFIRTVLDWRGGGPYGDGESVTDKTGNALMERVAKKIQTQRAARFKGTETYSKTLTDAFNKVLNEQ
jgi:hypothetical protein